MAHSESKAQEIRQQDNTADRLNLTLKISGMWCPACAWLIEEVLQRTGHVNKVSCNFSTDRVRLTYDPVGISPARIIQRIEDLGYGASFPDEAKSIKTDAEFIRFMITAFLTANVMMLSFALYTGFFSNFNEETVHNLSWPIFVLTSIVLFYGGRKIYQKALQGLFSAAFGMETLVTAAAFSAYLFSTLQLLNGSMHLYYDTTAMLITLVLLGKRLESRARKKINIGLEDFFSLQPLKAKICTARFPRGRYSGIEQLKPGHVFIVTTDEIIPADGKIVAGSGLVSESSLTGEPVPIVCRPGDLVRAGAQIADGTLHIRAIAVGAASTLGRMIETMERALLDKTPFEGKTDRLLQGFVPAILGLALFTGITCRLLDLPVESSLMRALTVMLISCPCALGIAIPLARVAGISLAGSRGLLIRSFYCFEQAPKIDTVVFDKTGTVTQGNWMLRQIVPLGNFTPDEVLSLAAALETSCQHPIALEISRRAKQKQLQPPEGEGFQTFENGASGIIGKDVFFIGSQKLLSEKQPQMTPEDFIAPQARAAADSSVYLSKNGKICAVFVFGDSIKATANETSKQLQQRGYQTYLISGDADGTTKIVGKAIGIDESYGNLLPRDKAKFIKRLSKRGHQTIMIGDGINDAPALVQADISMAVFSGAYLENNMADMTLMRGDPMQVIDFLDLAIEVNRTIFRNLFFSFCYNVVSIPVAMSGLLHPLIAVSAMFLSSLTVIGNTLLLIRKNTR